MFNVGQQAVTAFSVSLSFDGAAPLVVNWTGSLASGEGVDVEFCENGPCVALADGDHVANASVQLAGATDENASNDDYTANFTTASGAEVTWTVVTDNYPSETTWSVTNDDGSTVWSGGPYAETGTTYSESVCLPYGCYTLTVNDSYGDGICCAYGQGSFQLTSGGGFGFWRRVWNVRRAPISASTPRTCRDARTPQRPTTTLRQQRTTARALRRSQDARTRMRATTTLRPTSTTGLARSQRTVLQL